MTEEEAVTLIENNLDKLEEYNPDKIGDIKMALRVVQTNPKAIIMQTLLDFAKILKEKLEKGEI